MELNRGFVAIPAICSACLRSLAPPVRRSLHMQAVLRRPSRLLEPRSLTRPIHVTAKFLIDNRPNGSDSPDINGAGSTPMEHSRSEPLGDKVTGAQQEDSATQPNTSDPSSIDGEWPLYMPDSRSESLNKEATAELQENSGLRPSVEETSHSYTYDEFPASSGNALPVFKKSRRSLTSKTSKTTTDDAKPMLETPAQTNPSPTDTSTAHTPTVYTPTVSTQIDNNINAQSLADAQQHLGDHRPSRRLWIGNIFSQVDSQALGDLFGQFGHVINSKIHLTSQGSSRGWATIEFASLDAAKKAKDLMDKAWYMGRKLSIRYNNSPRTRSTPDRVHHPEKPTTTLYIGRLPYQMSDASLNEFFRDLRNVIDVRVAFDRRTGQPKGYAHCEFIDVESAEIAKEEIHAKKFHQLRLVVEYVDSQIGGRRQRRAWERARTQSTLPQPGLRAAASN